MRWLPPERKRPQNMLRSLLKWIKEHITVGAVKTPYGEVVPGFKVTIEEKDEKHEDS